jgi:hypothetical protein
VSALSASVNGPVLAKMGKIAKTQIGKFVDDNGKDIAWR